MTVWTLKGRRWWSAAALTLAVAAFLLFWAYQWLGDGKYGGISTVDETINRRTERPTPEITSGTRLSQTFVASDNDLTSIQLFFGTYLRQNTANVEVSITDERGRLVLETELDASSILDNAWREITFERISDSRGRNYEVTIHSPDGRPGNAFTAWTGNCDCYPPGTFSIDGLEQRDRELVLRVSYQHDGVTTWRELLNRMSQYKPLVFKGIGLVLLALMAAVFTLSAVAAFVIGVVAPRARRDSWEGASAFWLAGAIIVSLTVVVISGAYEGI